MRDLLVSEIEMVSGGTGVCTPANSGNSYGGVSDAPGFGDDLISLYEGLVAVTSHVIERVANAL